MRKLLFNFKIKTSFLAYLQLLLKPSQKRESLPLRRHYLSDWASRDFILWRLEPMFEAHPWWINCLTSRGPSIKRSSRLLLQTSQPLQRIACFMKHDKLLAINFSKLPLQASTHQNLPNGCYWFWVLSGFWPLKRIQKWCHQPVS